MTDLGESTPFSKVIIVGAGTVGIEIAKAHLNANIGIEIADVSSDRIETAARVFSRFGYQTALLPTPRFDGTSLEVKGHQDRSNSPGEVLVIESISERRDLKQSLYGTIRNQTATPVVIASNTSSLRLSELCPAHLSPEHFCGLHFFMPVAERNLVEIVSTEATTPSVIRNVAKHVTALGKNYLMVKDSPGFVVNRILIPYLNQSIRLLSYGLAPEVLGLAAVRLGMPFSPLELVDWIGIRTSFDVGRAAWQAFPQRIDPAAILPGMVKAGLQGRTAGCGFYDYCDDTSVLTPSSTVSSAAADVIARYQQESLAWERFDVAAILATPLFIEATLVLQEKLVSNWDDIELAMNGGLGFRKSPSFWETMQQIGAKAFLNQSQLLPKEKALALPPGLARALQESPDVQSAVMRFASNDLSSKDGSGR